MIKLLDILNELEIQPHVPNPIKRKGLKVKNLIKYKDLYGYSFLSTIEQIEYHLDKNNNFDETNNWVSANHVIIFLKNGDMLHYFKNPQNYEQKIFNKEFDSIQKIK